MELLIPQIENDLPSWGFKSKLMQGKRGLQLGIEFYPDTDVFWARSQKAESEAGLSEMDGCVFWQSPMLQVMEPVAQIK